LYVEVATQQDMSKPAKPPLQALQMQVQIHQGIMKRFPALPSVRQIDNDVNFLSSARLKTTLAKCGPAKDSINVLVNAR
jgi:hypothetical protein